MLHLNIVGACTLSKILNLTSQMGECPVSAKTVGGMEDEDSSLASAGSHHFNDLKDIYSGRVQCFAPKRIAPADPLENFC